MRKAKDGFWEQSLEDIKDRVKRFEEYYGLSSEEFLKQWRKLDFEDTFWTNMWLSDLMFLKRTEMPEVIIESDFDNEETEG